MHTASYDSMRASHRKRTSCDENHERYCEGMLLAKVYEGGGLGGLARRYPMIAVDEEDYSAELAIDR
jgi:hypothetical protein